jgi:HK97 family phage portal protein
MTQPPRLVRSSGGDGWVIPPPLDPWSTVGPYVWAPQSAIRIPSVARCIALYTGLTKQMPMDAWRGASPIPRPRLLARPDPNRARSWFVQVAVEDYLLNGNALALVTSRGVDGWPTTVAWLPAAWITLVWTNYATMDPDYYFWGSKLPAADVIHVRRGADRMFPVRGVGVVEQHLADLDRVAMESEYERSALAGGAVPSVAIIANTAGLSQEVADETKQKWLAKFAGPNREPAILPNGTTVVPLAWSPSDAQLTEARQMSLVDVANMFNIDGYWLGAPVAGMTYRTAGPQYQQILRTSLEPLLVDFEDVWGDSWLPRGQSIRFDRFQLLREDMATTATAVSTLVAARIITPEEARLILALPVVAGGGSEPLALQGDPAPPPAPTPAPEDAPVDDPEEDDTE